MRPVRVPARCPVPLLFGLVSLLAAGAAPARSQTVVGTITERGTARPVAGAFIVLVDEEGRRGNGVLSGDGGGYVLKARAPGRYRLVAEMIGYRSTTVGPVTLVDGASMRQDIEVPVEAVSLDAIQVETGERCRRRPGSGPATARLWDEARKALEVARWSRDQNVLRFQFVHQRRELEARTLRVLSQQEQPRAGFFDQSPFRSVPAERLTRAGYIQRASDGTYDYFAPDADVLLSESFLEDHCFRVEGPPRDEPDLIGLAFEPVPERELPDVRGVLWLDRGSAELRRLDFSYTDFPFRHGDWSQVGGRVEFERLATGMWIVRRWHIRMPLAAEQTGGFGGAPRRFELTRLSQQGGEVRAVTTRGGELVAEALGATLYGTVTAGERGEGPALAGARVAIAATDHGAVTGDEGAFRITDLPAGAYAVRISHPELEAAGIGALEEVVELESGRATRLVVGADLSAARARELCQAAGWIPAGEDEQPALVYGSVLGPDGRTPVAGAAVLAWAGGSERRTVADSAGHFRLCVGTPRSLRLAALEPAALLAPPERLDTVAVAVEGPGFTDAVVPLSRRVSPRPMAVGPGVSTWHNAVLGRVLEDGSDRPVAGALVSLVGPDGVAVASMVTDERGAFRLPHPDRRRDEFTLRVEHVAYGTATSELHFTPGQELRLDILVSPR